MLGLVEQFRLLSNNSNGDDLELVGFAFPSSKASVGVTKITLCLSVLEAKSKKQVYQKEGLGVHNIFRG